MATTTMTPLEAETLVLQFGGTSTSSVGSTLDFLVCGTELEDGRPVEDGSKWAKAQTLIKAQREDPAIDQFDTLQRCYEEALSLFEEQMAAYTAERKQFPKRAASDRKHKRPFQKDLPPQPKPVRHLRVLAEDEFLDLLPGRAAAELARLRSGISGANAARRKALDMTANLAAAEQAIAAKKALKASRASSSASSSTSGSSSSSSLPRVARAPPSLMWVDKYAPSSQAQLIGNNAAFERLYYWLLHWDALHPRAQPKKRGRGTPATPRPPLPAAHKPSSLGTSHNMYAHAALLSGPPGIGKSTSAHLAAKMCGRVVVELNASDKRNAKTLATALRPVTSGMRVLTFASGPASRASSSSSSSSSRGASSQLSSGHPPEAKHVVIMDEVDGLAGNDDRGGTRELIALIAQTRIPIICACNDRSSTKVRSLANHCLDLPFTRPRKEAIARRLVDVAAAEGVRVDAAAVQKLAESVGGDVRQVLHTMESWSRRARRLGAAAPVMDAVAMGQELSVSDKDSILRHTGFSAAEELLLSAPGTQTTKPFERLRAMTDLFFVDYDFVPLLVQQNYVQQINGQRGLPVAAALSRVAYSAQAFADADVLSSRLRSQSQWSLLPAVAALTVRGAACARSTARQRPGFTEWFAKNSSRTKRKRLLAELSTHMSARVWGLPGRTGLVMDHLSVLRDRVFIPLYCASSLASGSVTPEQAASLLAAWPATSGSGMWADEEGAAQASEEPADRAAAAQPPRVAREDGGEEELALSDRLVRASVGVMGEYGLSKEDAMESMAEVRLSAVRDPRTMIDSKTKLLVTKHYAQLRVRSQALVEEQGMTKAKRARRAKLSSATGAGDDDEGDAAAGGENDDEEAEDSDIDIAAFAVKKKAKAHPKAKGKGRAASAKRGAKRE